LVAACTLFISLALAIIIWCIILLFETKFLVLEFKTELLVVDAGDGEVDGGGVVVLGAGGSGAALLVAGNGGVVGSGEGGCGNTGGCVDADALPILAITVCIKSLVDLTVSCWDLIYERLELLIASIIDLEFSMEVLVNALCTSKITCLTPTVA
jgi:hypothetical protein